MTGPILPKPKHWLSFLIEAPKQIIYAIGKAIKEEIRKRKKP